MRVDRLQQGLFLALAGLGATVLWTHGEVPRSEVDGDLLALSVTAGPTEWNRGHAHGGQVQAQVESLRLTVTAATEGVRTIARLNGFEYRVDVTGEDTVETVRDDLLSQIQAGEDGDVTATAVSTDAIDLVADWAGAIWQLGITAELAASNVVEADAYVEVSSTTLTTAVTLQAYSQEREPRDGATALLVKARKALRKREVQAILERYGLGLWRIGTPIDLSAIAGAHWETRSAVDLTIAARSVIVEEVEVIEHASMTIDLLPAPNETKVATATVTVDSGA